MKGDSVDEGEVGGDGEGGGVGVVKFGVALGSLWLIVKVFFWLTCVTVLFVVFFLDSLFLLFSFFCSYVLCFC